MEIGKTWHTDTMSSTRESNEERQNNDVMSQNLDKNLQDAMMIA